ncbi:MAG TPA: acetyl-CoA carboxylase carboxyltransferase subunit beta [Deltaproteobacteria bacterium]|nr:acetyl-CoA carboxylase carboxyltransferase subunit beta [Deltaproteobacteria bacterium]HOM29440.1 acetyl-CoA carboxylase carboxyltransferase subunit beta [Deltaproteobacteria bacterium]HPP80093.1 acetyl-CoA carboxylase carboxyltransferase subunit beta [Deltaproteobacteria bacterium]
MTDILEIAKKDGRWTECPKCSEIVITEKLRQNLWVCQHCGYHFRVNAPTRIEMTCDEGSFVESMPPVRDQEETAGSHDEAITCGRARIMGRECAIGVMDFFHKGGSMGAAVGEAIVSLMQAASRKRLPIVMFCASGGVRVQEGIWGLFQMLRTVHARTRTSDTPMITVFTDPTTGGVTASFAALADVMIAEPGSRIGFAGPRVIEATMSCTLPEDFQDASRLVKAGLIDMIVHRHKMRETLAFFLEWFSRD